MKRRVWRGRWVGVGLAVALVGVVMVAVWPRGPRLEWYTSHCVSAGGKTVRFRILAPAGWQLTGPDFAIDSDDVFSARIAPSRDRPWFLGWMSRIQPRSADRYDPEEDDGIDIDFMTTPPGVDAKVRVSTHEGRMIAYCEWPGQCTRIHYSRADRAKFEATYRPICESFRVEVVQAPRARMRGDAQRRGFARAPAARWNG